MTQKPTTRRFRFSMGALLVLFTAIALAAGLLSRTVNQHLHEQQVASAIEETGASVLQMTVPPEGTTGRLLYRFGVRSAFQKIVNIEFDRGDKFSDALAEQIGQLPYLRRLKFDDVPITDDQLSSLAKSQTLRFFELFLDTKILRTQRVRGLDSQLRRIESEIRLLSAHLEHEDLTPTDTNETSDQVDALKAQLNELRSVVPEPNEEDPSTQLSEAGLAHLKDHPSLNEFSIRGYHISDEALRGILDSIAAVDTKAVIKQRRRDELVLSGVSVQTILGSDDWKSKKRLYEVPDDAKRISLLFRDATMDFARLKYVIPSDAMWQLEFPSHVPLGGKNPGGFRMDELQLELEPYMDRVRSISANADSAGLWELLEYCSGVEHLSLISKNISWNKLGLQSGLKELWLPRTHIVDDNVEHILKLTNLKTLAINRAGITTYGLQRLIDSDLRLEKLFLPTSFEPFVARVKESGLAKEVQCDGFAEFDATTGATAGTMLDVDDPFRGVRSTPREDTQTLATRILRPIHDIESAMRHASFPRPNDSPQRPEDKMLYRQREMILAYTRYVDSTEAIKLLHDSLKRSPEVALPISDLIESAPKLRIQLSQHQKGEVVGTFRWDYYAQISRIYGAIADQHKLQNDLLELEMRVRQAVWAQASPRNVNLPTDDELIQLCMRIPNNLAREMKSYFFLLVDRDTTEFETPPTNMLGWYPGRPEGIPMLAPFGMQITSVTTQKKTLTVDTIWNNQMRSDGPSLQLPQGEQVVYVPSAYFPISVELDILESPNLSELQQREDPETEVKASSASPVLDAPNDIRVPNDVEFDLPP